MLNNATNLKLSWTIFTSQCSWAKLLKDRVLRGKKTIQHHIFPSIWSSVKDEFNVLMSNSIWLLGNGENINFWNDPWCGVPLSVQFQIPAHISAALSSKVCDYIVNGGWHIPPYLSQLFPTLNCMVNQIIIPLDPCADSLLWKHTDDGDLHLKDAYLFKTQGWEELSWAKYIWSIDLPPSKSFLVWRLFHDKIPTDEHLKGRGCYIPSMCNLCSNHEETSFHLFFECWFAIRLWSWLAGCLNLTLQFTNMEDMWKLCELNFPPQSKITLAAAIINLLNTIWFARNQLRFKDKLISWRSAISMIIASTSMAGNNTKKCSSNSMRDFTLLKKFNVNIHRPRAPYSRDILWNPPLLNWVKCNTDGASIGNPGTASCGGVFRDSNADFLLAFAEPLGFASSYLAELCGAMKAVEIANANNSTNIWIETDSTLVVAAFNNPSKPVPWPLRNRWRNVLVMIQSLNFIVSHICREGNKVADLFANHGLTLSSCTYWNDPPLFSLDDMNKNKLGLPNFRYVVP
jgi:ribonuclease HI